MPPPLRSVHIYVAEGKPAFIAALHFNSAGILYEQDDSLVAEDASWEAVVPILRDALQKFSFRDADLREGRLTDWPSYQASGLRSVRQFQNAYLCIQIIAFNEAELFYDASSRPPEEADITLHVTLNPYGTDEEIARLLGRLHQACMRWKAVMPEQPPIVSLG
jgi:hypothetical protein